MKPARFLLRICDLTGCERRAEFLLDDARAICGYHAGLFYAGSLIAERERRRRIHQNEDNPLELTEEELLIEKGKGE